MKFTLQSRDLLPNLQAESPTVMNTYFWERSKRKSECASIGVGFGDGAEWAETRKINFNQHDEYTTFASWFK